jgi:hypothetical protein
MARVDAEAHGDLAIRMTGEGGDGKVGKDLIVYEFPQSRMIGPSQNGIG